MRDEGIVSLVRLNAPSPLETQLFSQETSNRLYQRAMTISEGGAPKGDRIAKLLARAGVASRREIERMIADGRVALDGVVLDTPATILPSLRGITVDGDAVEAPAAARLFLYHKPTGLLVTERDPAGRPTIYDRLPRDLPRLVPVGRLDLNTEGLLLLTTDGGLKRQLELPASGVERAYRARAYGTVTQQRLEELIEGIEIEGVRYGSIDANIERRTGANVWIEMILTEGKNREVRRVLEHLELQVSRLIRTRYGPFLLGDLRPGEIGEVKQHDLVAFLKELARGKAAGPGARANIGISADAGAGAGIGGRSRAPAPATGRSTAPRAPVRAIGDARPARAAKPERIRPTASQQRGDAANPWTNLPTRLERNVRATTARPTTTRVDRRDDRDRGEELHTSPKIKHFRAAKPPRGSAPDATQRFGREGRPAQADGGARAPADKRAARSAAGRPGAAPRPSRADAPRGNASGQAQRPGKGPSGGRGHPPRPPRGGRK